VRTERDTVTLDVVGEKVDYGMAIIAGLVVLLVVGFLLWRKNKLPFLKNKPTE